MFKVVDLFAGPGGLAEGFSSFEDNRSGTRPFCIALSIEKEAHAFATLRLRAFRRQFGEEAPAGYGDLLVGQITLDELAALHPREWAEAEAETLRLELGTPEAEAIVDARIDALRATDPDRLVLVGGPPCQAYSLVGRARNRGNADYVASEDHRHFLYREYIRILDRLRPAVFVMENVKGFLSARVDGQGIFPMVMSDLQDAGPGYRIFPLADNPKAKNGARYVIQAERYGIPQARHRVILFGVRADLWPEDLVPPLLEEASTPTTVMDVLRGMPELRSGLSKAADSAASWREAVSGAFLEAAASVASMRKPELADVERALRLYARTLAERDQVPPRSSSQPAPVRSNVLAAWLTRSGDDHLPNHDTRGHMVPDLARYAFVATFAELRGRSPKATDFPPALAPEHENWDTGKFADRFRAQRWNVPSTTITSHISKDGHYFIHPDPMQCRSLTVREAARLQTFPDDYLFMGGRTHQYVQVGNAVPPLLARQIASLVHASLEIMELDTAEAVLSA